jgi:hypothetical protein
LQLAKQSEQTTWIWRGIMIDLREEQE